MKYLFKNLLCIILLCISSSCFGQSPSGTTIPPAINIVDSNGGVWTVDGGGICYLNGVQAGNCSTVQTLLLYQGKIYVYSTYGTWWLWNGTGWGEVSGDPRTGSASPSGTTIPPATQILDSNGGVWTVSGGVCYLNGLQAGNCFAVQTLLFNQGRIYVGSTYGTWWLWNGASWGQVSGDPRLSSPNGTAIPPAAQIVDPSGNVWTVAGGLCYVNGVQAGNCFDVQTLLLAQGQIYVGSTLGTWWLWTGTTWIGVSKPAIVSPSGATIPSATQIVDANGNVWTVNASGMCYLNGVEAGNCFDVKTLLFYRNHIYVYSTLGMWWLWTGSSWAYLPGDPRTAAAQLGSTSVLTHHYNNQRTGWNSTETTLTPQNISSATNPFGAIAAVPLDDQVDAQPLVEANQPITCAANQVSGCQAGNYQVVYVATENNSVYAINAANGAILLQRNFGPPVPAPFGCTNNTTHVGINSTPVINPNLQTLNLITYTLLNNVPTYTLHAVNLSNLTDSVPPMTVSGSNILKNGATVQFNATYQRQRAALLYSNMNGHDKDGKVYTGFSSWCDFNGDQSRGWLLGWDATTLAPLAANQLDNKLSSSPNNFFLSSIWMSGSGVATDDNGNLWFTTGNSDQAGTTYQGAGSGFYNIQESAVRISSDLTHVIDLFTTYNWASLDGADMDFGSGGIVQVLPQAASSPPLLVAGGKDGRMFLLNGSTTANLMGGYTPGGPDKVVAQVNIGGCWCEPSNFMGADGVGRIVSSGGTYAPGGDFLGVWKINQTSTATNLALESSTQINQGTEQDPSFFTSVSSNGQSPAIIWAVGRPQSATSPALTLYAFAAAPSNGTLPLLGSYPAGPWPNLNANANTVPVVANGQVFVASYKLLTIFGLAYP
jgi:hypothetical protein